MPSITEEALTFRFPEEWSVCKFDDWSFYRNQFQRVCGGSKAVDILAIEPNHTVWIIEIKDYRRNPRLKSIELVNEIAEKVRDTLAALVAAGMNAPDAEEKGMARKALTGNRLRIVLHLEQSRGFSRLYPRAYNQANIQQKLRQELRAIDPHARVLEMNNLGTVAWSVS